MKQKDPNQLSVFDIVPGYANNTNSTFDDRIRITTVKFVSQDYATYQEIFRGYNELRAITYSYSLSFIEEIMQYFNRGEVIIGFDKLVNKHAADLFALQEFSTNYVCSHSYLQKRIQNDEFRFYVLNDLISHQKIYLLKSDTGKVRTIIGSANFSKSAWTGEQFECIMVCDDPECYEEYAKQYKTLQSFSSYEISKKAVPIKENGENASELPFFQKLEKENAVVIHAVSDEFEQEYAFHTEKLSEQWNERLKAVKLKPAKDGKTIFELKHMTTILDAIKKDNVQKKKHIFINPQFILNFDDCTAAYNQLSFCLTPDSSAVLSDLEKLLEYMSSFDLFTKDTFRMKRHYWKVLNYMFLSPFIAKLRYEGDCYGYEDRFFPMYLLICGDSDAGKTKFVQFIWKLMFNDSLHALSPDTFSSKPMTSLKVNSKGCPILIDELTPTYWKYARDIVKMDTTLIREHLMNHPTFILLSNDINNVAPELSKRIIVIHLDNRLDRKASAYNGKKVNTIRQTVSNALYCEYLRRMFPAVDNLIHEMQQHDIENDTKWIPDLFELSSKILIDIMHDFQIIVPDELCAFTWFDYMGDSAIAEKATDIIKEEYAHNSEIFSLNFKKNEVEIDFSCYDTNESKKRLRILHDELPADIECKITGTKAVLKLDAIQKHSGIHFKRKPFWRRK